MVLKLKQINAGNLYEIKMLVKVIFIKLFLVKIYLDTYSFINK